MAGKYQFDPEAYKRRLAREKERPDLKERFTEYEKLVGSQPEFDTEKEAVSFTVDKTKAGEKMLVFQAPKELGGKWKAISMKAENGMLPDYADQLGWSMIYDDDMLADQARVRKGIDNIKEV